MTTLLLITFIVTALLLGAYMLYVRKVGASNNLLSAVLEHAYDEAFEKDLETNEKEIFEAYDLIGKENRKRLKLDRKIKIGYTKYDNKYLVATVNKKSIRDITLHYGNDKYEVIYNKGKLVIEGLKDEVEQKIWQSALNVIELVTKDFDSTNIYFKYATQKKSNIKERYLVNNGDNSITIITNDTLKMDFALTVDKEDYVIQKGTISIDVGELPDVDNNKVIPIRPSAVNIKNTVYFEYLN